MEFGAWLSMNRRTGSPEPLYSKQNALNAFANDSHNLLIGKSRGDLYSGVNINGTNYTFIYYKIVGTSNGRRIDKFVIDNNQNINGVTGFSYSYLESTNTEGKIKIEGNVSFAGEYAITDSQLNRILNPDSEQDSENPTDQTDPSTPTPPEDTKPLTITGAVNEFYPDKGGNTLKLSVINYTEGSSVSWTSSSDAVSIDQDGVISASGAVDMQDVTFTATTSDSKQASVTIKVGDYSYDGSTYHIYTSSGLNHWLESANRANADVTSMRSFSMGDGQWSAKPYEGTFDGCGYTISNLKGEPLTGRLNGTVKNLKLENINISFASNAGAIALFLDGGTIENCEIISGTA